MCADAEQYLWEQASAWGSGEDVQRRVRAVGRAWARDPQSRKGLQDLLEVLCVREAAPRALEWLREGAQDPSGS